MPRMTALKEHPYAGKIYRKGEQYEAAQRDVVVLVGVGWSKELNNAPHPIGAMTYPTRDMAAAAATPYQTRGAKKKGARGSARART